jgi:hypothetical protein
LWCVEVRCAWWWNAVEEEEVKMLEQMRGVEMGRGERGGSVVDFFAVEFAVVVKLSSTVI